MKTFVEHLTAQLDNVKELMFELLDNSRIQFRKDNSYSTVVVFEPSRYWDEPNEIEQSLQVKLNKLYRQWFETFRLFTENSSEESKYKRDQTHEFVVNWIEKKSDWGIPSTIPEAKTKFNSQIQFFFDTLNLYANIGDREIIILPDTNALIQKPNPKDYKALIKEERITLIYLPTVLSELDELKIKSRNPDFQKKVKSVIKRLKGYRNQGSLIDGIIAEKSVLIKMVGSEPNFNRTLSWLDRENNDDRIIASALEMQRDNPSSVVCIVTSDINLQNKSEMAQLSYIDID